MRMDFSAFEHLLRVIENGVLKKHSYAVELVTKGKAIFGDRFLITFNNNHAHLA